MHVSVLGLYLDDNKNAQEEDKLSIKKLLAKSTLKLQANKLTAILEDEE